MELRLVSLRLETLRSDGEIHHQQQSSSRPRGVGSDSRASPGYESEGQECCILRSRFKPLAVVPGVAVPDAAQVHLPTSSKTPSAPRRVLIIVLRTNGDGGHFD